MITNHHLQVNKKVLKGSDNLRSSTDIYTLKGFSVCFKLCLFKEHD